MLSGPAPVVGEYISGLDTKRSQSITCSPRTTKPALSQGQNGFLEGELGDSNPRPHTASVKPTVLSYIRVSSAYRSV